MGGIGEINSKSKSIDADERGWMEKKVVGIVAGGFQSRRGEDEVMAMGSQACERKKAREESFGRVPTGWESCYQEPGTDDDSTRPCDYRQRNDEI